MSGAEKSLATQLADKGWLLIPMLVPVAVIVGIVQGAGAAFLVLIAAALITVIALFWSSVRTLLGETPLSGADAYALAAPRAEEEQKQAVLRALKDLEFERSVGKISDEDYAALVAKYRAEAKRLLRVLEEDAKPRRQKVEGLVHARLVEAGLETMPATYRSAPQDEPSTADPKPRKKKRKASGKAPEEPLPRTVEIEPEDAPGGAGGASGSKAATDTTWKSVVTMKTKESAAYAPPSKRCSECATRNDPDAVFCKKCGSKVFLGEPKDASAPDEGDPKDDPRDDPKDVAAEADTAKGGAAAEGAEG
jgi:ribosomal protein L40E